MATFNSIWERMLEEDNQPPLLSAVSNDEDDEVAMTTFKKGMNLRSSQEFDETFWKDLKKLASENKSGLAKLLQISPAHVSRWCAIIDNCFQKVSAQSNNKNPSIIHTAHKIDKPATAITGGFGDRNHTQIGPL